MEQGPIAALYRRPHPPGHCQRGPHFDMKPGERLVPVRPIDHQAGRSCRNSSLARRAPAVHLDVRNVTKTFSQRATGPLGQHKDATFRAVDDEHLHSRGECFGLVGESAAARRPCPS
jgi:peptide/nickel transport system ATP-binding protein